MSAFACRKGQRRRSDPSDVLMHRSSHRQPFMRSSTLSACFEDRLLPRSGSLSRRHWCAASMSRNHRIAVHARGRRAASTGWSSQSFGVIVTVANLRTAEFLDRHPDAHSAQFPIRIIASQGRLSVRIGLPAQHRRANSAELTLLQFLEQLTLVHPVWKLQHQVLPIWCLEFGLGVFCVVVFLDLRQATFWSCPSRR